MKSIHHTFDIDLAAEYGIAEAIMIHHFQHWISYNQRLERNFRDGRTWTYQTIEEVTAHFPYLSRDQVNRLLRSLVEKGVLLKANFNKKAFDRTLWFAFRDEGKFLKVSEEKPLNLGEMAKSPNGQIDSEVPVDAGGHRAYRRVGEIATPIPDTQIHKEINKQYAKEYPAHHAGPPLKSKEDCLFVCSPQARGIEKELRKSLDEGYITSKGFTIALKSLENLDGSNDLGDKGTGYFFHLAHHATEPTNPGAKKAAAAKADQAWRHSNALRMWRTLQRYTSAELHTLYRFYEEDKWVKFVPTNDSRPSASISYDVIDSTLEKFCEFFLSGKAPNKHYEVQ